MKEKKLFKRSVFIITIYFLSIIAITIFKDILGLYHIQFRDFLSDILMWYTIIGFMGSSIFFLLSLNKWECKEMVEIKYVMRVFQNTFLTFVIICGVILIILYVTINKEREEIYQNDYISVISVGFGDEMPLGLCVPIGPFFRKPILSDDKLVEELLSKRYGMKFTTQKDKDGIKGYVPEKYPQLFVQIIPLGHHLDDFSEKLTTWYFIQTCEENQLNLNTKRKGESFYIVIDSNSDLEAVSKDAAFVVQTANSDEFYRNHAGTLSCILYKNKKEKYAFFSFGSNKEDGKEDFFEEPENVYAELLECWNE